MHEQSTSKAKSSKICSICILPQSKNYAKITVLKAATAKGLRFSVLKYFVLRLVFTRDGVGVGVVIRSVELMIW